MDPFEMFFVLGDLIRAGWVWSRVNVPLLFSKNRRLGKALDAHLTHHLIPISSPAFPGETLATLCVTCDEQHGPEVWSARCDRDLKELEKKPVSNEVTLMAAGALTGKAWVSTIPDTSQLTVAVFKDAVAKLHAENGRLVERNETLAKQLESATSALEKTCDAMERLKDHATPEGKRNFRGWVIERAEDIPGEHSVAVYLAKGSRRIFVRIPWEAYLDENARWTHLSRWIVDIGAVTSERIASYIEPDAMPTNSRDKRADDLRSRVPLHLRVTDPHDMDVR